MVDATIAASQAPIDMAVRASWRATKDDEHSVLIILEGPLKSKVYDTRFASIDIAQPLMA